MMSVRSVKSVTSSNALVQAVWPVRPAVSELLGQRMQDELPGSVWKLAYVFAGQARERRNATHPQ